MDEGNYERISSKYRLDKAGSVWNVKTISNIVEIYNIETHIYIDYVGIEMNTNYFDLLLLEHE